MRNLAPIADCFLGNIHAGEEAAGESGEMSEGRGGDTRTLQAGVDGTQQLQRQVHRGHERRVSANAGVRTPETHVHQDCVVRHARLCQPHPVQSVGDRYCVAFTLVLCATVACIMQLLHATVSHETTA